MNPSIANIGDVLAGKYRVDRMLGIGGMGIVVEAMHLELDQRVALKFMLPEAVANADAVNRFLREARAAVKLRSEHVCRVIDTGRLANGSPYIVMEFLEGHDFTPICRGAQRSPIPDVIDYLLQATEGVAEAHANGIVHRDLKPGNLFLTTDNDGSALVKVLDFGISKLGGASSTKTNDVMGSPAYMAPEQMASSKKVDSRADVWALGVILYEALSGKLPFAGDSIPMACISVMNDPPIPLAQVRSDLPAGLADAVMKCLHKNPDERYQTVSNFAGAIAPYGPPGSEAVAFRISKVLRRSNPAIGASNSGMPAVSSSGMPAVSSPGIAVTVGATSDTVLGSSQHRSPQSAAPSAANSTLRGSAGELASPPVSAPRRRRTGLIAGVAAALVTTAVGVSVLLVMRDRDRTAASAESATTTIVASPPTAAPPAPPENPPVAPREPAATSEAPPPDPGVKPDPKIADTAVTSVKRTRPVEKNRKPGGVETKPAETKPAEIEIKAVELPRLSRATVEGVARANARDLSKCEGTETLRGEVTIRFQIDAKGKVTSSQLSSSIGKPIVAGCILRALQRWQFPATATGAQGTYTSTYQ